MPQISEHLHDGTLFKRCDTRDVSTLQRSNCTVITRFAVDAVGMCFVSEPSCVGYVLFSVLFAAIRPFKAANIGMSWDLRVECAASSQHEPISRMTVMLTSP